MTFTFFWCLLTINLISGAALNSFRDLPHPSSLWERQLEYIDDDQLEHYLNTYAHSLVSEVNFFSSIQSPHVQSRRRVNRQLITNDPLLDLTGLPRLRQARESLEDDFSELNVPGAYHIPGSIPTIYTSRELVEVKATEIPSVVAMPYYNSNPNLNIHVVKLEDVNIDLDDVTLVSFLPVESRDRFEVFGHKVSRRRLRTLPLLR